MKLLPVACVAALSALAAFTGPALGASTAFRIGDLDLRDPHVLVDFIGCRDITDNPLGGFSFNGDLQARIEADADSNGFLDLSLLVVFDPLDQAGPGGAIRFGSSSCATPLGSTTCGPDPSELLVTLTAVNGSAGACLGILPGTVRPYSPAVTVPEAPCFASDEMDLNLDLGTFSIPLRSARIAATYSGSPATMLVSGLIRGFLTEADANNILMPFDQPLIGGKPLSALLPGGDPPGSGNANCAAYSDKDLGPDGVTPGWWMYFTFVAGAVPYTGPQVAVSEVAEAPGRLWASPNPFGASVTLEWRLARDGPARVAVYDLSGREVAELASGSLPAGSHRWAWDGRAADGSLASPGLYLVRASGGGGAVAKRVVLLR